MPEGVIKNLLYNTVFPSSTWRFVNANQSNELALLRTLSQNRSMSLNTSVGVLNRTVLWPNVLYSTVLY